MARHTFDLAIVTPERPLLEGKVASVILPASDGYLGVWAHHADFVASTCPGVLHIDPQGNRRLFFVSQGFAEMHGNRLMLLVDAAEAALEIDVDRAQAAAERARSRLQAAARDTEIDAERAGDALARAQARLQVAYLHGES